MKTNMLQNELSSLFVVLAGKYSQDFKAFKYGLTIGYMKGMADFNSDTGEIPWFSELDEALSDMYSPMFGYTAKYDIDQLL